MRKQQAILVAAMALIGCLALLGSVGGWYLANRGSKADPGGADRTSSGPEQGDSGTDARTYQLDKTIKDENSASVTLAKIETAGGKMTVHVRYRNDSSAPWPLTCPSLEEDQTAAQVTLSDGQVVHPESTWCGTTRPGESFDVAPGAELTTWAVFAVVPDAGQSFQLGWYDFPVLADVRLG